MFAIGFTWCFHVYFTLQALFQRQPDVLEYGRLFSWAFIWIANLLGILAVLCAATPLTFRRGASILCTATSGAYSLVWDASLAIYRHVSALFA